MSHPHRDTLSEGFIFGDNNWNGPGLSTLTEFLNGAGGSINNFFSRTFQVIYTGRLPNEGFESGAFNRLLSPTARSLASNSSPGNGSTSPCNGASTGVRTTSPDNINGSQEALPESQTETSVTIRNSDLTLAKGQDADACHVVSHTATSQSAQLPEKAGIQISQQNLPPRTCFICLDEGSLEAPTNNRKRLDFCCTQCFAVVHKKCWCEWRKNQRFATLRARLLAYNQPDPFACSICKSGIARVNDEDTMIWATNGPSQQRLQDELFSVIGRMLNDNSDDEEDPPLCTAWSSCFALSVILGVAFVDVHLICFSSFYPGDVLLLSFLFCYHVIFVQLAILAILQRWRALGVLRDYPGEDASDTSSVEGFASTDLEMATFEHGT